MVWLVIGAIVLFVLYLGNKRWRELTRTEYFHISQAREAGRREDAVIRYHSRDRNRAQKMLNSKNPKTQAKGKTLLRRTDKLIAKEMSLVHRIADSARVHPQTGETIRGIRRD